MKRQTSTKMADVNSDFRTKKKNVCDSIIFEVDLADCSPEHSPKHGRNDECNKKSSEYNSQDSGVFSQETKIFSQEIEISESQLPDESEKHESSCVTTELNTTACDEADTKVKVVESQISIAVQSSDDVGTVDPDHTLQVAESDIYHLTITQNITSEEKQATLKECVSSITVSEEVDDEKQENVVECVDVTNTTTKEAVVEDEVQIKITDVNIETFQHLKDSETLDTMNAENLPEEGEVVEESSSVNASSIISISFKDIAIAKEYKPHFLMFLHAHPELNVVETDEDSLTLQILRDADLSTNEWIVMDEACGESLKPRPRKRKRSERKKEKDTFMLDTNPSITTKENAALKYMSKFCVTVNEGKEKLDEVKTTGTTCFNCDGNHSLKDCKEPKNFAKINTARTNFKSTSQVKSARYHLEEDQMYSHLSPGKISDNLRKALGLHRNELPPYIYRMRMLGYPPGWIKEAEEDASNLCMFDIEGKTVSNHKRKKCSIDPDKVVAYPGFNAPMEKGVHDEYRYYGVPPFSVGHDKQVMIDFINKMKAKQEDNMETCDMEVDKSFEETITEISENDISQDSQDETQQNSRASPTLNDLESRKQQLLAELDTNTTSDSSKSCDPDTKESSATVKTSSFGTPILKSASPYSKLPKPDNFSQNISPVINFENLPNATGKYEQMTGILQRVRTSLKGLQDERKTECN